MIKKIVLGFLFSAASISYAGQRTDYLTVTGSETIAGELGIVGSSSKSNIVLDDKTGGSPGTYIAFKDLGVFKAYLYRDSTGFSIYVATMSGGTAQQRLLISDQNNGVFRVIGTKFGVNGLDYVWPSSHTAGIAYNNGSGTITWGAIPTSGGGGGGTTIWSKQDGANVDTAVSTLNVVSGGGLSITSSPSGQINLALSASSTYYSPAKAAVTSVSVSYLVTSTDTVVLADATSASLTVTLPTAVGATGKVYRVKRQNSGSNTVTIATTSSQTIDGSTTQILTSQYTSVDLISDGTSWSVL